ncbi:hypoxia induced protein conserved region-domain-containing protein [Durotheca rogersii]|uniref:hypoxia induced protein conserved region-domain-containing protein n=1 Tax=Durotheca rogersii TaxID=419775 RepID=UPI00221FEAFE|nr:hypoxia induced protein conserved region-domain-containing protein [Durotheca rogersii]KAI5859688.1 hypoxia induced protein conserved region-domain-containing protein [Durotheca rogersii]
MFFYLRYIIRFTRFALTDRRQPPQLAIHSPIRACILLCPVLNTWQDARRRNRSPNMTDRSMPSSFDQDKEYNETGLQKVGRKLREEPLIPLGTALTCLALYNAFRATRRGDHVQVQRMFRARVGAQAFTVVAMVAGGAYYGADREKRKELIKLEAQQRAEERHQKWLKELEVRDEEEKQLQAAMKRRQDRVEQRRTEKEKEVKGGDGPKADTASDTDVQASPREKDASNTSGSRLGTGK